MNTTESNLTLNSNGLSPNKIYFDDVGVDWSNTSISNNNCNTNATWTTINTYPNFSDFWSELSTRYGLEPIYGLDNRVISNGLSWKKDDNIIRIDCQTEESPDKHAIFRVSIQAVGIEGLKINKYFNSMDAVCEFFDSRPPKQILESLESYQAKYQMSITNLKTDFDIEFL